MNMIMKKIPGIDPNTFETIYYDIYEEGDWVELIDNNDLLMPLGTYEVSRNQNSPRLFIYVNGKESYVFDWRAKPIYRQHELFPVEQEWKFAPGLL